MNLISDALAQTETPATAPAPATPAAPAPQTTQTGTAASGAPDPTQPPSLPDLLAQLVPIFVVMGIVYILVIRPRARREQEQLAALRNVRRGDVVATTGGLIGKVTKSVDDNEVELEIAPNTRIRLLRAAITEVRAKGEPVKDTPVPTPTKPETKPEPKAAARTAKTDARTKSGPANS
jgi:preprotein translocase subunit YajC